METIKNLFSENPGTTNIPCLPASKLMQYSEVFASITADSFYIWDIVQKRFCYIKPDDLFLCGHSVEEAMELGYGFYSLIIHPEDLSLWTKILEIILLYLKNTEEDRNEIDYFSCTFRLLRKYPFSPNPLPQMIYLQIKPFWIDVEPHYLICTMENSVMKKVGNLHLHKTDNTYSKYRFFVNRWYTAIPQALTERETAILILATQKRSSREIADILCKGQNTIQNQIKALFAKLDVHSMQEAIEIVKHYYKPLQITAPSESSGMIEPNYRERASQMRYIQELLNKSKSIRQIAKMVSIAESTIRYWINKGLLYKKRN